MHGHKKTRRRSAGTLNNWLNTLSRIFSLGVKELHLLTDNPVSRVSRPSLSRGRQRFLSDDEVTALLAECKRSSSKALYAFVLLLLTTGMRKGEAYAMKWPDIDVERRWLVLMKTKTDTARGVPLTQHALDALMALPRRKKDSDGVVFPEDLTKAWRYAIKRAGITNFRIHDLRHSAASLLVRDGATLLEVGRLLGHADPRTTNRYSHLARESTAAMVDRVLGNVK